MKNSNSPEGVGHWDAESREWRKLGMVVLVGATALAASGRVVPAAKAAAAGGAMLIVSEIERRVSRRFES